MDDFYRRDILGVVEFKDSLLSNLELSEEFISNNEEGLNNFLDDMYELYYQSDYEVSMLDIVLIVKSFSHNLMRNEKI